MIDFTLRNAVDLPTHQAQSPAEIYFLIMGKEAAIQSACLPVILGTDHHAGTRSPEHFLLVIILSVVALHGLEDAAAAERIAELVEETTSRLPHTQTLSLSYSARSLGWQAATCGWESMNSMSGVSQ